MSNNTISVENNSTTFNNSMTFNNNTTFNKSTTTFNYNAVNFSDVNVWRSANKTPVHILLTVLNVILIVVIVIGNSLTIRAITKFKYLRHQSSVMLAALAVADLMMGVAYSPLRLVRSHLPDLFRLKGPCYAFIFAGHFSSVVAIGFLSLLSLERFYSIQFPFHYYAHATVKSAIIFCLIVYVFVALAILPMISGVAMWYDGAECYAPTLYPSFYTRFIVFLAIGPLLLGFVAFLRVMMAELRMRKIVHDQNVVSAKKQESLKTKLMMTAYVVSLSFWIPHVIFYLYDSISKTERNEYLFRVISFLDLGSSSVNCFLYAWKNSKFKAAYKALLGFQRSQVTTSSSVTAETG